MNKAEYAEHRPTLRSDVRPARSWENQWRRSLDTVTKNLRVGFVSQRTHGTMVTIRGTIVNTRDKIVRNKRVRVGDEPAVKLKHSSIARQHIPYRIVK